MTPRVGLVIGCLAVGLLGTLSIASAKDTSTCETLAGALSGAERPFAAGTFAQYSIAVAKMVHKIAATQPASSIATRDKARFAPQSA
jgi:hypothetical protein